MLIHRPRLLTAINRALDHGALALWAPVGFGKTVALRQAVVQRGETVAWVSCAEHDGLLSGVLGALRTAVPGAADAIPQQLGDGETLPQSVAEELLSELSLLLVDPLVLVIDDAERLADDAGAMALLERLLRARLRGLRVAVAARRVLPVRMAKELSTERFTVLGSGALAFTVEETVELMWGRTGRSPSRDVVERLMETTEGWPLGVAVGAPQPGAPVAASASLEAYVREELLDELDRDARAAVLRSSLVDSLPPAVCDAVGLPGDLRAAARRGDLLLRELPNAPGELRWRPLVRELLRQHALSELPHGERRRLHADVAAALQASGRTREAAEHWLDAERWEEAVAAIGALDVLVDELPPAQVRGWLARLPDDVRSGPQARMVEASLILGSGDVIGAIGPLRDAIAGFEQAGDERRAWLARRLIVPGLMATGGGAELVELARSFDDPAGLRAGHAAGAVAIAAAQVLRDAGGHEEAAALIERVQRHPGSGELQSSIARHHAVVAFAAGRVDDALASLAAALVTAADHGPGWNVLLDLSMLATMHDAVGREADAASSWDRVLALAERTGASYFTALAHLSRAVAHARAQRLDEADVELACAGDTLPPLHRHLADCTRAICAQARGDGPAAADAVGRAVCAGASLPPGLRAANALLLAPVLAGLDRHADADELVAAAAAVWDERFPGAHGPHQRARLLAMRAWLASERGDAGAAVALIAAACREAGPALAHVLRPELARLRPLVQAALAREAIDVDATLAALESASPDGAALVELMDDPDPALSTRATAFLIANGHPDALRKAVACQQGGDPAVAGRHRVALARLREDPPALAFSVLGRFELRRGGWRLDRSAWRRPIAARVVRLLLASRRRPVPEDFLFEQLWPGSGVDSARRSLHVAVSQARAVLDPPGATTSAIAVVDRTYELVLRERDAVDADRFERFAAAALAERGSAHRTLLERAVARWTGEPLLEDRYADWAQGWRDRLLESYQQVLLALALRCEREGDSFGVFEAANLLLREDPGNELAHRLIMRANARIGRTAYALRQYLECRSALLDELGIEPSAETRALQARILAGDPV